MIKSTGTGGWATGFHYSSQDQSYLISGTMYTNSFWDITVLGAPSDKFQCFVTQVVHDPNTDFATAEKTVSRALAEPQICVGGNRLIDHGNSGFAAILGTSGQTASVQLLTQQANLDRIEPSTKLELPDQSIPVASTSYGNQFLYVASHGTGGWSLTRETSTSTDNPNGDNLKGLSELYWLPLTNPPVTENSKIYILKYDTTTKREVMNRHLTALPNDDGEGGTAVVAAIDTTDDGNSILVAGSSNGHGDVFGNPLDNSTATPNNNADPDGTWDGYLTWLDSVTAVLQHSMRLNIHPGIDDNVRDICRHGSVMYVVGTSWTPGPIPTLPNPKGFVIKIDLNATMIRWIESELEGEAVKCVADEMHVYVARHVEQHHGIQGMDRSLAQNIILSKFHSGPLHKETWSERIDTTKSILTDIRNDFIVGLELGPTGNVVALVNSINYEQGLNDVIMVEFLKDTGRNDLNHKGADDKQTQDTEDKSPTGSSSSIPKSNNGADDDTKMIYLFAILIPIFLAVWVIFYHFVCSPKSRRNGEESDTGDASAVDDMTPGPTIDDEIIDDLCLEDEANNEEQQQDRQIV